MYHCDLFCIDLNFHWLPLNPILPNACHHYMYVRHLRSLSLFALASPHSIIALPLSFRLQQGWGSEVLAAAHTFGGVCDTHSHLRSVIVSMSVLLSHLFGLVIITIHLHPHQRVPEKWLRARWLLNTMKTTQRSLSKSFKPNANVKNFAVFLFSLCSQSGDNRENCTRETFPSCNYKPRQICFAPYFLRHASCNVHFAIFQVYSYIVLT